MPVTRQGAFIGAYGTQARGSITFDWVPDPEYFQDRILFVKDALEDRTVPLILSQEIVRHDIAENFAGEHDPQGQPWQDWSADYEDPATGRKTPGYASRVKKMSPPHSGRILDRWGT